MFNDFRHFAGDIHHHAVGRHQCGNPRLMPDADVFAQMPVFAMHWQQHVGQEKSMHMFQIRTVGVARDMVFAIAVIDDINTDFRQRVDDLQHFPLIPRNGFRRKQEHIARLHLQPQILAARKLRRCGTAFALRSSHDQHQIFARHFQRIFGGNGARKIGHHTRIFRRRHHPLHRPAQQTHSATRRNPSLGQSFQPRHVGCESGGHNHATSGFDQFGNRVFQRAFRPTLVGGKHVCAVAHQRLDRAFRRDRLHQRLIKTFAHNRSWITLKVAGMDDPARRRVDDQGGGFRD